MKKKTFWGWSLLSFLSKAFLLLLVMDTRFPKGWSNWKISEEQEERGDKPNEPLWGFSSQKWQTSAPGPTLSESSFHQERNLFPFASSADQFPWEMSKILAEYWTELKFLYVRPVKVPMGKPNLSWHVEYVNCFMAPKESIVRSPPLRVTPTPMSWAHWAKCW